MNAIKRVIPSIHLRELRREELKNFFGSLVDIPLNNRLSECYRKWRNASPDCQFGILLEVVRSAYNHELMKKFDARVMRTLKQKENESVVDFNTRFLRKLNELYPGYEDKVYKIVETSNDSYEKNFLKYELFNIYVTALKPKLGKEIPAVSGKEKCLEFAMKKAEFLEGQFAEREKTNRDRNPYVRPKVLGITRTKGITCQNCGLKEHLRKDCRKPKAKCKFCGKEGHLIQFCFGRKRRSANKNFVRKTIGKP